MRAKLREIDGLAVGTITLTVMLGFLVRQTLNPDGVSYLDLAAVLRRGDFHHFVQGYWSPLYPALLALVGDRSPGDRIAWGHLLNVLAVAIAVAVIWRWARAMATPWFGRAALAALIVCSAEPPRVEALTPDLLLLAILAGIAYVLIASRDTHWATVGALFGLAYLTKTGIWPWLLVAMALRTLLANDRAVRIATVRSHLVTAAVICCWVLPLSIQSGQPTFGSTGRLNLRWYLLSSDARTPDTDHGEHRGYRAAAFGNDTAGMWAAFDDATDWTYQPWSNPDGWSTGALQSGHGTPALSWLLGYWVDTVIRTASLWLRTLLVFVLIPALWIGRRPGRWRALLQRKRLSLVVMLLGTIGIGEYVAVHAEPRLIAPFALFAALGALAWLLGDEPETSERAAWHVPFTIDRLALSFLGVVIAAYVSVERIYHAEGDRDRIASGLVELEDADRAAFAPLGSDGGLAGVLAVTAPEHPRVVVIGPALPVVANIFWLGGKIVAQLPPESAAALGALPPDHQRDLVQHLFHDRADVLWLTSADGAFQIVRVP
jgi:dolichyl-phosphate-mannose-protein mannosyltransferase